MSDDLVERLLDWPYQGETMAHEAADRIEALTAQLESTLRDRELILEERDRTFALMLSRAEKAEAESDRLRKALAMIDAVDPEHHIDGCALPVVRGLVLRMGETARAALKGESHE